MSLADRDLPIAEEWLLRSYRVLKPSLGVAYAAAMADPTKRTLIRNTARQMLEQSKRRARRFDSKLAQLGEMQPEID